MTLKEILEVLVKGIVQTEEDVAIKDSTTTMHGKETLHFKIKVKKEEFSLLVGKGGSTIIALRTVMAKLAGKQKKVVYVDLDENKR